MSDLSSPRELSRGPALVFAGFTVLGVIVFLAGLGVDADRTWRTYLQNWLLWAAIAQGALVLSAAFRLTNARWQGPLQRLAESFSAFVPISLLLFFGVILGREHLFEWIHHPVHGKEWWFTPGFTFGRDLGVLLWMTLVSKIYLYISLRPTLGQARESATGWRHSMYARWTSGWRGEEAERDLAERRGRKMAVVVAISYALCYGLLAIDLVMSLSPHWISTMFPGYYTWGGFLGAISLLTLVSVLMRNTPEFSGEITASRRHDMGKMIFAFSIFWMYLFWSQYLVIWYGNIPEETGFVAARLGSEFLQDTWYFEGFMTRIGEPYVRITLATWTLLWVLPFWVLLGVRPKKNPAILGTIAAGSVLGFWLERYILVTPSLVPPVEVLAGATPTPFGWIEIGLGLGFLGLFMLCFLTFGQVFPGALPRKP